MMQVLEEILQEIEEAKKEPLFRLCDFTYRDRQNRIIARIEEIIRSHMGNEDPAQDSEYVWFGDTAGGRILRLPKEKKQDETIDDRWIPVEDEQKPPTEGYIYLSFANFNLPMVGRYEEDETGGAFYIGDEEESCISQDMIVNAWKPVDKPYRPEERK